MIIVTATLYQIYYFGHRKKNMIFFLTAMPLKNYANKLYHEFGKCLFECWII